MSTSPRPSRETSTTATGDLTGRQQGFHICGHPKKPLCLDRIVSKIQAWSSETAGRFDLDAELELWFSGLGMVRLDFQGQVDIRTIGKLIGSHVL